jgi:hypothetical protein
LSDDDDLGAGFWWKVIGGVVLVGIVAFILLLLLTRVVYAWGVGAAFLGVIVVLLGVAWFYDRRNTSRRARLHVTEAPLTTVEDDGGTALPSADVPLRAPDDDLGDRRIGG